ncbi:hypothetical protein GY45DRAFT_1133547 [Cubamyces sp. BRFM 1775]|nr:hypothetical protein GY45DRAFT_1133547 [Cubamyces sp. BRFM 1775]
MENVDKNGPSLRRRPFHRPRPKGCDGDHDLYTIIDMLDALSPSADGVLIFLALKTLIIGCKPSGYLRDRSHKEERIERLSRGLRELIATGASLGHAIDSVFFFYEIEMEKPARTDDGNNGRPSVTHSLRVDEYDATASLVCTTYGKAAAEDVRRGWNSRSD